MAQPLAAFQGSVLYLDTIILVGFMDTESPWHAACRQFLYQAIMAAGLLPRDAIHLSVMRRLGITAIASDDDDFERMTDLTLFKP